MSCVHTTGGVLSPITIRCLQRPDFENTRLDSYDRWVSANSGKLARYWHELGQTLGITKEDESELNFWLKVQWEIEQAAHTRALLPHGDSL